MIFYQVCLALSVVLYGLSQISLYRNRVYNIIGEFLHFLKNCDKILG